MAFPLSGVGLLLLANKANANHRLVQAVMHERIADRLALYSTRGWWI